MIAALALVLAVHTPMVAVVNSTHATRLAAGTHIACTLATPVDSRTATKGEKFELYVTDAGKPELRGAVIDGYVTGVTHPRGLLRARIAFLFSTIRFVGGAVEPIRAYVLHENVVPHTESTPHAMSARNSAPGMSKQFAPAPSTIVFEMQIGAKTTPTASTGGYVYASTANAPIIVGKGTPVTIELASALRIP